MATQPAFQNNVSNQENSSGELSLHNPHGQSGQGMHKGDSFFFCREMTLYKARDKGKHLLYRVCLCIWLK